MRPGQGDVRCQACVTVESRRKFPEKGAACCGLDPISATPNGVLAVATRHCGRNHNPYPRVALEVIMDMAVSSMQAGGPSACSDLYPCVHASGTLWCLARATVTGPAWPHADAQEPACYPYHPGV